jgi:ligand-binding sensor domain-containing protein
MGFRSKGSSCEHDSPGLHDIKIRLTLNMRYGLVTILILLFTGLSKPVSAQKHIFKNYSVNDGLIANAVRRVFQDSKGFLWIATWEGLSKYDGHKFTNYTTANGLSHNLINDIYESADGKLYIANNGGTIDIIDENKVTQGSVTPGITVNRFAHLPDGKLVALTDDEGLQEFNSGKLSRILKDLLSFSYLDLAILNDSLLIVVGVYAIQLLNRQHELLAEIRDMNPVYSEFKILQDSKKRIFVGTETGLKMLELPEKGQPITFSLPSAPFNIPALRGKKINDIFEDTDGSIWFATSGGLIKISANGAFQLMTKKDGLASDNITTIFQDREKNIWFGTFHGLSKLVTKSSILIYTTDDGLLSNRLYFLQPIKERLLVSTQKGTQVFNTGNGKFDHVTNISDPPFYSVVPNSYPPLVMSVNKLLVFDTATLQYEKTIPLPFPFPLKGFSNITSDRHGNFLLSDHLNLYFISEKKDQTVGLLKDLFNNLLMDTKGDLWAGTWEKGLYHIKYSFTDQRLTILANEHFLPAENIRSLFEDSKGNIWVGTRYHGVYRFSKNGTAAYSISNIDQSKGLSSNWIKGLAEAENGDLWVDSYQGLDKLIQQDSSYRVFNFSRVNNFFGTITGMVTGKDHSLWLATREGMVHITDGEMERMPALPVYITKVASPDSIYSLGVKLNLGYRHNQLQFEFSSPGFINEKQLFYSYRLSGTSNAEWTEASNQHTVSYASLQPGNYRFEVRTMGWNGEWGKPATFEFTIKPPFWQTWWFILLLSLFAALLIYILVKRRIGQVRKEGELKQKITETEMSALRAQMNPHFIFNCLNSIDSLIQNNEKEKATTYLAKFAKLIRAILENSKNNAIPCWKDMETLKLYLELEELRCDKKFIYQLNIDPEVLRGDYKVPPLVIQPFVENAIHHGLMNKKESNKELQISVCAENNEIRYVIEDNGVGRKQAAEYKKLNRSFHNSMGMDITKERINLFNGQSGSVNITDLYDEQQQSQGTKVEIRLINQN